MHFWTRSAGARLLGWLSALLAFLLAFGCVQPQGTAPVEDPGEEARVEENGGGPPEKVSAVIDWMDFVRVGEKGVCPGC